jgi:hypothetical protein
VTVLQALALAQGATSTAALDGKAEDLKLEADDILFVPDVVKSGRGLQFFDVPLPNPLQNPALYLPICIR